MELKPREDFDLVGLRCHSPSSFAALRIRCQSVNARLITSDPKHSINTLNLFNEHVILVVNAGHLGLHADLHPFVLILVKVGTFGISGRHGQVHLVALLDQLDSGVQMQGGNRRDVERGGGGHRERQVRILHGEQQRAWALRDDGDGATLYLLVSEGAIVEGDEEVTRAVEDREGEGVRRGGGLGEENGLVLGMDVHVVNDVDEELVGQGGGGSLSW